MTDKNPSSKKTTASDDPAASPIDIDSLKNPPIVERHADFQVDLQPEFLDLFSKAQAGELNEQEEACFDRVCEQIDYRRFCAERDLPRYMEALVVRKSPALIRYLGGANIRLAPEVARQIDLVEEGEYFGAHFTLDREGKITDIRNVVFVPSPETVLANDDPRDYAPRDDDFPASLKNLLPEPGRNKGPAK
jgi:hypothetical protein